MIISLGEGLIDFISQNELSFSGYPGGSPYNSSIAIARLNVPVQYVGRISKDIFGDKLLSYLNENNVGTDLTIRTDDPTTLSFVQKQSDGSASYAFFANDTADKLWQAAELDKLPLPEELKIIHFGSISLSQEPSGSVLTEFLIKRCSEYLLSFDPNIRPALVSDRQLYMERFESICSICSIVKLSDEDLEWLYPGKEREEAVSSILGLGTALVALTEGKEGGRLFTENVTVHSPLFDLPVADTIGAGDTFHGALLAYLYKKGIFSKSQILEMSEEELISLGDYANKAAGINCSRNGANPPSESEMIEITL
ncbi:MULTISPECIES: carbohydrate kinase [unclassified Oceanispirochaeta]|uniref:carbohydrate kinase family protein n=1 Tax=unclassified Oceanispirochaeta TaxID=2635722 RepID=UPI000E0946EE|nr:MULTISPECIES: carbohydrate kinase [unclassified Oceanispirochaeta]MBF9017336.1 carbohydrate kinase [Oceanispirochaeta sp. M2]NPD73711.1 carbohydrate kinase [Oceanispirochaeta sp. M1]RDG30466.1 carbohydrate kinase [Oceanispirochaeta sp. M1]